MHTDMALDRPLLKEYPFTCPGISHSLDREWDKPGWKRSYGVRFQLGKEEKKESILLLYKFKENERKMAQSSLAELYKNWFSAVSILGTRLLGGVAMTARPLGVRASIT